MPKTTGTPGRSARKYKYTSAADRDVKAVLAYTTSQFGVLQRRRYAELIDSAASMVGADPMRPGSVLRDDLGAGLRSFHIEFAARRRAAAAHVLYYLQSTGDHGREGVIILRVLHERMDPTRHFSPAP